MNKEWLVYRWGALRLSDIDYFEITDDEDYCVFAYTKSKQKHFITAGCNNDAAQKKLNQLLNEVNGENNN